MTMLSDLLECIKSARIAVIGDFCLDAYWDVDLSASEKSLETDLDTNPVRSQRYAPGGAGNVMANIAALGTREVHALGVVGNDPFGNVLKGALQQSGAQLRGLLTQSKNWQTHVYAKPRISGKEQNRFDFGCFNQVDENIERALIHELGSILSEMDLVVICQQMKRGIWTDRLKTKLTELIAQYPDKVFLVDGRDMKDDFAGTYRKLNEREALNCWATLSGQKDHDKRPELEEILSLLYKRWGGPTCLTRGAEGALLMSDAGLEFISGIKLSAPLDIVGAGDSVLAGMAAALASGAGFLEACQLGNLCAAVTIQKIGQTGTAAPQEILELEEWRRGQE